MTTTRRTLLRGAPAAVSLVTLPAVAAASTGSALPASDAALIRLEAELDRLWTAWNAVHIERPDDDDAGDAACNAWWSAAASAIDLSAQTGPGLHAKAGVLQRLQARLEGSGECPNERKLSASLLRDMRQNAGLASARAAASPAHDPDAGLIATCERFDALEEQVDALYATVEDDRERDALLEPITDQQRALLDPICDTPAFTLQGLRRRAQSVALWDKEFSKGWSGGWHEEMAWAVMRDLIGGAA